MRRAIGTVPAAAAARPAFEFAPDLCTGCEACRIACGNENASGGDTGWRQVITFNSGRHPALPTLHLSIACNHCDVPACANGCPADAYIRDSATGAVLIDADRCIGCRYCSWVCPYDAPRFDERAGVMTKCTFCVHRLSDGAEPACVAACPTGALRLDTHVPGDPEPPFPGLGEWRLGPALRIVPPARPAPPAGLPPDTIDDDTASARVPAHARRIGMRSEKSLISFTLVVPALAAWFAGGLRMPARAPALPVFLPAALLAFALSAAHLGRPLRAWRAVLGWRTSWLSREIAMTGTFVALASLALALPQPPASLRAAALAAAIAAMIAMDMTYAAIARDAADARIHGSGATLTFLLLAGIVGNVPALVQTIAAAMIVATLVRSRSGAAGLPRTLTVARVVLLALAALAATLAWPWMLVLATALVTVTIGRIAFYESIEPSSPAARVQRETIASLARRARGQSLRRVQERSFHH